MASLPQPTVASLPSASTRQRLVLCLLLALSLVTTTIAIVAVQRPPVVPAAAPVSVAPAPAPGSAAPVRDRTAATIDAYEQLQFQRLAAEQAVRAGDTDAYELAVSGVLALQRRVADLQARQQTAEHLDRAIIDAYGRLHLQRLAAEQALRAGNPDAYEVAVSGAEALQSRITRLRAGRAQD
jgi:hypothetical protein